MSVLAALLFGAAPIVSDGRAFTCTPTHVWDGDGPIWCAEGPKIRLSGIAAREIDGECRSGHPCPATTGVAARDALVRLLGGPRGKGSHGHILVTAPALACVSDGSGKGDRTAARCQTNSGTDLSCAMIANEAALRWERYDRDGTLIRCAPQD